MLSRRLRIFDVFVLVLVVLCLSKEAHAYVDPGTGSYLLQILVAGFLGLLYALRLYWTRLKNFLISRISRSPKKDE
ncbi:MAG TPA: hypothetical protein VMW38_08920 [Terriglobia bacterium]|nr:hypothetical protein [Terriglobia bacterium]